jgi:hypothetical protein
MSNARRKDSSIIGLPPAIGTRARLRRPSVPVSRIPSQADRVRCIARYVDGWATLDMTKVASAVTPGYVFIDPLVGTFDRETLTDYIAILKQRLGFDTLPANQRQIRLDRHGALPLLSQSLRFWRSIPGIGLEGPSEIWLNGIEVCRETVCYELNMASELLRAGR